MIIDLDASPGPALHQTDPNPRITASLYLGGPKFSPDGKALVYMIHDKGADNLWLQPLDGSPGRQITKFPSEQIPDFRWSPDGSTLAVTREQDTSDVVVLRENTP